MAARAHGLAGHLSRRARSGARQLSSPGPSFVEMSTRSTLGTLHTYGRTRDPMTSPVIKTCLQYRCVIGALGKATHIELALGQR
jgi:hypothetical protein